MKLQTLTLVTNYSEVPNGQADRNKRAGLEKNATLLAYLLSKSINEQGGIFRLLHEKLQAGWNENLKNLSEHALLLGTSEYTKKLPRIKQDKKWTDRFNFKIKVSLFL